MTSHSFSQHDASGGSELSSPHISGAESLLYYRPTWVEQPPPAGRPAGWKHVLAFCENPQELGDLVSEGTRLVTVGTGSDYRLIDADRVEMDPAIEDHHQRLAQDLSDRGFVPDLIVYAAEGGFAQFQAVFLLGKLLSVLGDCRPMTIACIGGDVGLNRALFAFFRSIGKDLPAWRFVVIDGDSSGLANELSALEGHVHVRLENGSRRIAKRVEMTVRSQTTLKQQGVYLITGCLGDRGSQLAVFLAKRFGAHLLLVDSQPAGREDEKLLEAVRHVGGEALYQQADVTDAVALTAALSGAEALFGSLNGVFHYADCPHDTSFAGMSLDDFNAVLAPKVTGTVLLDALIGDRPLDFFVAFSSVVAHIPNAGQADYAFANAYMEGFLEARQARVSSGFRHGQSLWICPPHRADDGVTNALDDSYCFNALMTALGAGVTTVIPLLGQKSRVDKLLNPVVSASVQAEVPTPTERNHRPPTEDTRQEVTEIAVIGLAGRYPMAQNTASFWENLAAGRDCITPKPDHRRAAHDISPDPGGYLEDVDLFDAFFFKIAPRDAANMDPQERLFLEVAWETLEDAGYTPDLLGGEDRRVGVYVGAVWTLYQVIGAEQRLAGNPVKPASLLFNIPNRVSYFMNFRGPSLAVDTACSASLTAIHLAYEALCRGECHAALAGGVNLNLHHGKRTLTASAGILSPDGVCRTFGKGANGYVAGEGVGAVLLKPLPRAHQDGDRILGVIEACVANHGGRASGYSAPNPNAQADLIDRAIRLSGADAESITYIEAHGTGTELGDPVEVAGMTQAFRQHTDKRAFCAIGSVKTNVGHLEAAAGIAGFTKLLLQFQAGRLAPSLHAETLNPFIEFADSPFVVCREAQDWQPHAGADGSRRVRAGLSAFGAGGSNIHLILASPETRRPEAKRVDGDHLVLLSAYSEDRLRVLARRYLLFLEGPGRDAAIADIAYTTHVGRKALSHRLALVTPSTQDLKQSLHHWLDGITNGTLNYGVGQEILPKKEEIQAAGEDLPALAALWVRGAKIPVPKSGRRMGLPTYPFARDRHWIETVEPRAGTGPAGLHPLLDRNGSNVKTLCFYKHFDPEDPLLRQHAYAGKLLPAMVFPEMVRAAATFALGETVTALSNAVWAPPENSGAHGELAVRIYPGKWQHRWEITHTDSPSEVLAQGNIGGDAILGTVSDLNAVKARCVAGDAAAVLEKTAENGFAFGESYAVLTEIYRGRDEALAFFECKGPEQVILTPTVLELAAVVVRELLGKQASAFYRPVALDNLSLCGTLSGKIAAHFTLEQLNSERPVANIRFMDETGQTLAELTHLALIAQHHAPGLEGLGKAATLYYQPVWEQTERVALTEAPGGPILLLDDTVTRRDLLVGEGHAVVLVCPGERYQQLDDNHFQLDPASREDFGRLCRTLSDNQLLPQRILILWNNQPFRGDGARLRRLAQQSMHTLLFLSQALMEEKPKNKVRLLHAWRGFHDKPQNSAAAGFHKTIRLENPRYIYKSLELLEQTAGDDRLLLDTALAEFAASGDAEIEIRYRDGERFVRRWRERPRSEHQPGLTVVPNGVYLITGGMGGLGLILARHLAQTAGITLVLVGRQALTPEKRNRLTELEAMGANASYRPTDISAREDVRELIRETRRRHGRINGVFHAAGVTRDAFLIKKTEAEVDAVIAAKLYGTVWLDEALGDEPLDYFICFSSLSAAFGNIGQTDYAYANSFLDGFCEYRSALGRPGVSTSINWPLWKEGGMDMPAEERVIMALQTGLLELPTRVGLSALEEVVNNGSHQAAVVHADPQLFRDFFGKRFSSRDGASTETGTEEDSASLSKSTIAFLQQMVAGEVQMNADKVDPAAELEDFGLDSIMVNQFNFHMENALGPLPKTLLFEYLTIRDLAGYLLENHRPELMKHFGMSGDVVNPTDTVQDGGLQSFARETVRKSVGDIAVIGAAGVYAGADNLDQLWEILIAGRNTVGEVPRERWNHDLFYDPDPEMTKQGKSNARWGGFLEDADKFDPLFFKISPREAESMDPQERIFVETVWSCMEDAGYTPDSLRAACPDDNSAAVGVFAGVTTLSYPLLGPIIQSEDRVVMPWSSPWTIANRISYVLGFSGPSIPVDTACSSSAAAIHLACESLRQGQCEMAVTGGVNVYTHPIKYQSLAGSGMLSSDGRCRSYGEGGDGFVPGEGAGAVLIRPLEDAVRDGDQIYAVIKSTAMNHDGKTNGYFVPSPRAQGRLVAQAIEEAGFDSRTISYMEGHGTGTELGDPIEIAGLTHAFKATRRGPDAGGHCAIGSVKTNIGHLESAAGIVGLTKLLLQFKHKQIAPSLHAKVLNPKIDFETSPFRVNQSLKPWIRPEVEVRGPSGLARKQVFPRRAGLSSFGAGGVNAHVIMEEYTADPVPVVSVEPQLFVLSARNKGRLKEYARKMAAFFNGQKVSVIDPVQHLTQTLADILMVVPTEIDPTESLADMGLDLNGFDRLVQQLDSPDLEPGDINDSIANLAQRITIGTVPEGDHALRTRDIAFTSRIGREAMNERLAVVFHTIAELQAALTDYADGDRSVVFTGNAKKGKPDPDKRARLQTLLEQKDLTSLAELWTAGVGIDWLLLDNGGARRISLPTYPFARDAYWVPIPDALTREIPAKSKPNQTHPMFASNATRSGSAAGPSFHPMILEKKQ